MAALAPSGSGPTGLPPPDRVAAVDKLLKEVTKLDQGCKWVETLPPLLLARPVATRPRYTYSRGAYPRGTSSNRSLPRADERAMGEHAVKFSFSEPKSKARKRPAFYVLITAASAMRRLAFRSAAFLAFVFAFIAYFFIYISARPDVNDPAAPVLPIPGLGGSWVGLAGGVFNAAPFPLVDVALARPPAPSGCRSAVDTRACWPFPENLTGIVDVAAADVFFTAARYASAAYETYQVLDSEGRAALLPGIPFLGVLGIFAFIPIGTLLLSCCVYHVARNKAALARETKRPLLMSALLEPRTAPQAMVSYKWNPPYDKLAEVLADTLPDCWLDKRMLSTSDSLPEELPRVVAHARFVIILMTPAYLTSDNCARELLTAMYWRDASLPTLVLLEGKEWKDLKPDRKRDVQAILSNIKAILSPIKGFKIVESVSCLLETLHRDFFDSDGVGDDDALREWWRTYGEARVVPMAASLAEAERQGFSRPLITEQMSRGGMSLCQVLPAACRTLFGRPRNEELFAGHVVLSANGLGKLRTERRLPRAALLSVIFALVAVVWFVFFVLALCVVYLHTGPKSPSAIDGAWILTWVSLVHFFSCALLCYLGVTVETSHEDIHPALNAIVAASFCFGGKIAAPDSSCVVVVNPIREPPPSPDHGVRNLLANHAARNLRVVLVRESEKAVGAYAKEHEKFYDDLKAKAAKKDDQIGMKADHKICMKKTLDEEDDTEKAGKAVFEHENLTTLIKNLQEFLGDKALGLTVVKAEFSAEQQEGHPTAGVHIFDETSAADMSIYVFFVCSEDGLKAFCKHVTKKPNEWPRRQVVLVSPPYNFTKAAASDLVDVMSIMTGPADGSATGGAVSGIANRVVLAVCDGACYLAGGRVPRVA